MALASAPRQAFVSVVRYAAPMFGKMVVIGRAVRDELIAIDDAFAPVDVLITSACFMALVGTIDWMTSYEMSLNPFYLLLVMFVTWRCTWQWGLAFAMAALANQILIGLVSGYPFSKPLYFGIASLERLFTYLVVIALLTRLRTARSLTGGGTGGQLLR
jgi:hypothetical protein